MEKRLSILFLVFGCLSFSAVINLQCDGSGDFLTIQDAIDVAEPNSIIILHPGIYTGAGNRDIDFLGKAITVRGTDPANWAVVTATIIDPNAAEDNLHRGFYFHSNETAQSVLEGITIKNGYAEFGGGIACVQSGPLVRRCLIDHNFSLYRQSGGYNYSGGGIHCSDSHAVFQECIISGNQGGYGGGLFCGGASNVVVSNCFIIGNISRGITSGCGFCAGASGGGIGLMGNSELLMEFCTLADNVAFGSIKFDENMGHAVRVIDPAFCLMRNSVIWGSSWRNISSYAESISISYSVIPESSAGYGGVGVIHNDPVFVKARGFMYSPNPFSYTDAVDYHIMPQSPCVNAGDPNSAAIQEADIDGEPRKLLARVDMGADEVGEKQADFDRDGTINMSDFSLLSGRWLNTLDNESWNQYYDLYKDGRIDLLDLQLFTSDWLWASDY